MKWNTGGPSPGIAAAVYATAITEYDLTQPRGLPAGINARCQSTAPINDRFRLPARFSDIGDNPFQNTMGSITCCPIRDPSVFAAFRLAAGLDSRPSSRRISHHLLQGEMK